MRRLPMANERLIRRGGGDAVPQLKSPYHYGTIPIVLPPLEFM
ncbi:MAG: hypothetical protein ACREWG_05480 [Gammaproteobacteria bacterium]